MASTSTNPSLNPEGGKKEKPAAVSDESPRQAWLLKAGVAAVIATITMVTGLILSFVLFAKWREAAEVDQTLKTSRWEMLEQLQQCQKERHDLSTLLETVGKDARCSLCPDQWLWWKGHCYFFSFGLEENRKWKESAEFCQQHNSSLAVIKDSAEMDFLQGKMAESLHFPFLWVGLTDSQQEGQWLWWDGMDVQHYMPMTVEWDSDHRDCADMRGGGSLFAADCEEYGPWTCKRRS